MNATKKQIEEAMKWKAIADENNLSLFEMLELAIHLSAAKKVIEKGLERGKQDERNYKD